MSSRLTTIYINPNKSTIKLTLSFGVDVSFQRIVDFEVLFPFFRNVVYFKRRPLKVLSFHVGKFLLTVSFKKTSAYLFIKLIYTQRQLFILNQ